MNSIIFRLRGLSFIMAFLITLLSVLIFSNLAFCEERGMTKDGGGYGCRGEKKHVKYSDLMIDKDCMILMDSKGVKLIHEVGCDENGYYIYAEGRK